MVRAPEQLAPVNRAVQDAPWQGIDTKGGAMRSRADAIRREGAVVVTSSSISTNGLGEFNGWFRVLDAPEIPDAALGEVVAAALDEGEKHDGLSRPPLSRDRPDLLIPVYAALGVSSEKDFARGAAAVSFDRVDGVLYVQPMRSDERRGGGFVAHGGEIEYASMPSTADLGRIAKAGWDGDGLPDLRTDDAHT